MIPGSSDLAKIIEPVARELLGEPNRSLSTLTCLRFGSRGSLAVQIGGANAGIRAELAATLDGLLGEDDGEAAP